MAIDGRVSTYGFSLSTIARNTRLQEQLGVLQEQIATGVKSQTLKGYGTDSLRLQENRISISSIDVYTSNINIGTSNIKQMTSSVQEIKEQAELVLGALGNLPEEGEGGTETVNLKNLASNAQEIIELLINTKNGENYLFAGSDIKNAPLENSANLVTRVQAQVTSFLDGTNNGDTFLTNVNGYTDSQSGFSTGVQNSRDVYVRADDGLEIDYTIRANENGIKDILTGLTVLSELTFPVEGTDIATRDDYYKITNDMYKKIQSGVESLRNAEIKLANAEGTIGRKLESFKIERGFLQNTVEDIQSVDSTEAVIRFQAIQTQLEASFQATSIISSLSLARIL